MRILVLALALTYILASQPVNADIISDLKKILADSRAAIPREEDMTIYGWTIDQPTFNYKMPCALEDTNFTAIVVHGTNRKDILTDNGNGEFTYESDISKGFDRIADFCGAIIIPQSGLSTEKNWNNEYVNYRTWWMSEGVKNQGTGIPLREEADEIQAAIEIVKLANQVVKQPTYLVIGHDLGDLTAAVLSRIAESDEKDIIVGFIYVDRGTGEYTKYKRGGVVWKSKDN